MSNFQDILEQRFKLQNTSKTLLKKFYNKTKGERIIMTNDKMKLVDENLRIIKY